MPASVIRRRVSGSCPRLLVLALVAVLIAVLLSAAPAAPGSGAPPARAGTAAVGEAPNRVAPTPRPRPPALRWRGAVVETGGGTAARPPRLAAPVRVRGRQLRVVQFAGPIWPAWYAALARVGRVVTYLPDDAYLVWTTARGAAALDRQARTTRHTRYSGPVDPYYRLAPGLRRVAPAARGPVDVTVQVVSGPAGRAVVAALAARHTVLSPALDLGGLITISVRVPARGVAALARRAVVVNVEPSLAPQLDDEAQGQLLAGNSTRVGGHLVPTGPGYLAWLTGLGFPVDPAAYPRVAVVDDGIDNGSVVPSHPDLYDLGDPAEGNSRVMAQTNCSTDATADGRAGHGTLNAGIVGGYANGTGEGVADAAGFRFGLGVSPFGRLSGVKIFRNTGQYSDSACGGTDAGVVAAVRGTGASISSNSWGSPVGGAYDATARTYDLLVRDAAPGVPGDQPLFHVFAAGNDGPGGATIGSPGSAKNVLTVGATEGVRDQGTPDGCGISDADDAEDLAEFSSRGPTADGRIKPDLVAAGTHIQGPASLAPGADGSGVCGPVPAALTYPAGQSLYTWSSGTSHATPAVAGAAALVQQFYGRVLIPGGTASPAMLKALLVDSAAHLDGQGTGDALPSPTQGWGAPDLGALFDPDLPRLVVDQTTVFTASGQRFARSGTVHDTAAPVRVTLAWTDAAGPPVGAASVNDLDLEVVAGGRTYRGNVIGSDGLSVTGGAADPRNNVESVRLPPGTSGPVAIRVVARNIAGDALPHDVGALQQDFALTAANLDVADLGVPVAEGVRVLDADADGGVEPGEVVTIEADITDAGTAALPRGTASLENLTGPASLVVGRTGYPAIAAGATASARRSLVLRVDPVTDCGTPVRFEHVYRAGGREVRQPLELDLAPCTPVTPSILLTPPIPVGEGDAVDLAVTLLSPDGAPQQVTLTPTDGTAAAPGDFAGDPVTVSWAPGDAATRHVRIPVLADDVSEGEETFSVAATASTAPVNGPVTARILAVPPTISLPGMITVTEGRPVDVPVTLSDPDPDTTYRVRIATSPAVGARPATIGSDVAPLGRVLTWEPGDPATLRVRISAPHDGVVEPEERLALTLTEPVGAQLGVGRADVRLRDAVPPVLRVGSARVREGDRGLRRLVFALTLDRAAPAPVRFTWRTRPGSAGPSDVVAVRRSVTLAPGRRTASLVVSVRGDTRAERDETVRIVLSGLTGATLRPGVVLGTILDDD